MGEQEQFVLAIEQAIETLNDKFGFELQPYLLPNGTAAKIVDADGQFQFIVNGTGGDADPQLDTERHIALAYINAMDVQATGISRRQDKLERVWAVLCE